MPVKKLKDLCQQWLKLVETGTSPVRSPIRKTTNPHTPPLPAWPPPPTPESDPSRSRNLVPRPGSSRSEEPPLRAAGWCLGPASETEVRGSPGGPFVRVRSAGIPFRAATARGAGTQVTESNNSAGGPSQFHELLASWGLVYGNVRAPYHKRPTQEDQQ